MPINDKLKKCLDEGRQKGERHKGLQKVLPNEKRMQEHLSKANHIFGGISTFREMGYGDFSASAAFYALYHGLLALLAQRGYESRNQSCTFALVEEWIKNNEINFLTITDIKEIFDREVTENLEQSSKIVDVRERMQYGTKTDVSDMEFELLKKRTKELFDKIKQEVEKNIK